MTGSFSAIPLPYATPEGTERFTRRFADNPLPGHFRKSQGLRLSSIGLGTYLGDEAPKTDALYTEAIIEAVKRGCNVLDSAINYRCQRSERAIGQALTLMTANHVIRREEIVIATKGGYLPFDGQVPTNPQDYIQRTYIDSGIAKPEEIIEWNCIAPKYIEDQLERSLKNLRVACIDIYYLHNPEAQLAQKSPDQFYRDIAKSFELLERKVGEGKIRRYGTATWNGYRQQSSADDFLSLERMVKTAEQVAGKEHHFAVVQLPFNLALPEALMKPNQPIGRQMVSLLEAALHFGVTVMTSVPTMQGKLARNLPREISEAFPGLATDAQRAIQFARSAPGVVTALVGMKQKTHVVENLETARVLPAEENQILKLFEVKNAGR